jgi:uncharacterized protein YndB with AHSA1/START domain
VFEYWTKPELLMQWLFPPGGSMSSRTDLRPGGTFEHEMRTGAVASGCAAEKGTAGTALMHSGEYLEIKPPEKLVFTWNSHAVQDSRVTIELKDLGDATELWLTHELLPDEKAYKGHSDGWNALLSQLESVFAR